jgi:hypothetical protein
VLNAISVWGTYTKIWETALQHGAASPADWNHPPFDLPTIPQQFPRAIERMGVRVRDVLREKDTPYAELGLGDPSRVDDQLLDAMMAHPILISGWRMTSRTPTRRSGS